MPCGRKGKKRERIYCNDEVLYIGGIPGEGSEEDQENIGKSNLDWGVPDQRGGGVRCVLWIPKVPPPVVLTRALEKP